MGRRPFFLDGRNGLRLDPDDRRLVTSSPADKWAAARYERVAQNANAAASPCLLTLACPPPTLSGGGRGARGRSGLHGRAGRGLLLVTVRGGHHLHDAASCTFARQHKLTLAQDKVSALVFAGQPSPTIAPR